MPRILKRFIPSKKFKKVKAEIGPKPPPLFTAAQLIYCQGRVAGLTPREATQLAGLADNDGTWARLERAESVQSYMRELCGVKGITPSTLLDTIGAALQAKTVKDFCTKYGDVVSGPEREDHLTQLEAVKVITRMTGAEPSRTPEIVVNKQTNITVLAGAAETMNDEQLLAAMQRVKIAERTGEYLDAIDITPGRVEEIPEINFD